MNKNEKSTKSLILSVLGKRFPLSLNQIYADVKLEKNLSYQAVHKIIKELVKDRLVEKVEKQYFLNKRWIKQQADRFLEYYSNYFNTAYNPNQINKTSKIQIFRFTSLKDVLASCIDGYAKNYFNQEESDKIYLSVRRLLPFVPPVIIPFVKKLLKDHEIILLCRSNTLADRWVAKIYRSIGIKVKTGVDIPHYNSICMGDCVLQYFFFFNEPYRKKLYSFSDKFKTNKSSSLIKLTSDVLYKQTEIYVVVNRHPILVEDIKRSIMKTFEQNNK